MYLNTKRRVRLQGESWPTWQTIEAGADKFGFVPDDPGWILSHKGEHKYPNILKLANWSRKQKQTQTTIEDSPF